MLKKLKSLLRGAQSNALKRAPRIAISHLDQATFQIISPVNHKVGLSNLSTTGFGLKINLDRKWQQVGVVLSGTLFLKGRGYKIGCQVRHATGLTVGCEFLTRTHMLEEGIHGFLSSEVSSLGLRKVDKNLMTQPADWYVDGLGNELFLEKNLENNIEYFYATFLSNWVEWRIGKVPKYGYVVKSEKSESIGDENKDLTKKSDLVRLHQAPPPGIENLFARFLESIPQMSDSEKKQLVTKLVE